MVIVGGREVVMVMVLAGRGGPGRRKESEVHGDTVEKEKKEEGLSLSCVQSITYSINLWPSNCQNKFN